MDMASIAAAASSLKVAADIAKGLSELKSAADIQGKVIDLQREILSAQSNALTAQSEQFSMLERIRELETEIARVKAWEETKERYQLHEPTPGTFVYALKEQDKGSQPLHWICAHCYNESAASILQLKTAGVSNDHYLCPKCKTEFKVRGTRPAPKIDRGPGGGPQSWMAR